MSASAASTERASFSFATEAVGVQAPTPKPKRKVQKLTNGDRKWICRRKREYPNEKFSDMQQAFNQHRNAEVELKSGTVSGILKQEDKWLCIPDGLEGGTRTRSSKEPELEAALYAWRNEQLQQKGKVRDEDLRDKARELAAAMGINTDRSNKGLSFSSGWLDRFKKRNRIEQNSYKRRVGGQHAHGSADMHQEQHMPTAQPFAQLSTNPPVPMAGPLTHVHHLEPSATLFAQAMPQVMPAGAAYMSVPHGTAKVEPYSSSPQAPVLPGGGVPYTAGALPHSYSQGALDAQQHPPVPASLLHDPGMPPVQQPSIPLPPGPTHPGPDAPSHAFAPDEQLPAASPALHDEVYAPQHLEHAPAGSPGPTYIAKSPGQHAHIAGDGAVLHAAPDASMAASLQQVSMAQQSQHLPLEQGPSALHTDVGDALQASGAQHELREQGRHAAPPLPSESAAFDVGTAASHTLENGGVRNDTMGPPLQEGLHDGGGTAAQLDVDRLMVPGSELILPHDTHQGSLVTSLGTDQNGRADGGATELHATRAPFS